MNKKGFTLIEIIICVSLLVLIGAGSIYGINLVNKKIVINKLSKITDKVLKAAEVYLETNEDASKQLYQNKNGVVIPLNVLINKGLLDLKNTDLKESDYKNEYVISFLQGTPTNPSECTDIRSATSWDEAMSEPIYICTQTSGGKTNSNISIIDPDSISNKTKVERKIFYYKGEYPNNNVTYTKDGTTYQMRILSVDIDDSITVVKNDFCYNWDNATRVSSYNCSFDKIFSSSQTFTPLTPPETYVDIQSISSKCENINGVVYVQGYARKANTYGGRGLTSVHYNNTTECFEKNARREAAGYGYSYKYYEDQNWMGTNIGQYRYVHLKPCMKITNGTGAEDNPFILEQQGTC